MRFAHIADCHIGSWKEAKLKELTFNAFSKAINICIEKQVDFVLISGDLFNTSFPTIDLLQKTVSKLVQLKKHDIPIYVIPGSHDYSPSGKTMLNVLEEAQIVTNVAKGSVVGNKLQLQFTVDSKTGAKITGMMGKKLMLERQYYEALDTSNLNEEGFKIFMFHTALSEFKPKELEKMDSSPLSLLPKWFDYYAGGHVHYVFSKKEEGYGLIVYPGPIFPNNLKEVEDELGGFCIYEDGNVEHIPLNIANTYSIKLDCTHKTPQQITDELMQETDKKEFLNTIVTIRIFGKINGKLSEIGFKEVFDKIYSKSALFVMKNTAKITTDEFEEVKISNMNAEEIEDDLIKEHLGQSNIYDVAREIRLIKEMIQTMHCEKQEGEKNDDYEKRITESAEKIFT